MKRLVVVEIEVMLGEQHLCDRKCPWIRPSVGCTLFEKQLISVGKSYERVVECLAAQIKPGDQVE